MIAAPLLEKKQAKLAFFAAYFISVVLILVVFAALWKNEAKTGTTNTITATPVTTGKENLTSIDAVLLAKLEGLDRVYTTSVQPGAENLEGTRKNIQAAENAFERTLDSAERVAIALPDAQQKGEMNSTLEKFKKIFQSRSGFMANYITMLADTAHSNQTDLSQVAANNAAVENLKGILVEKEQQLAALEKQRQTDVATKDKMISSLQTQLSQKPSVPVQTITTAGDSEWRQKHAKLKASYDNLAGQNNALNKSYKVIVEDNRRLLSQLQAARKQ